ncbi:formate dehydrogenase subunit delta [Vineibacter terrae]|uniref:formate dehydrogenase subunit delta n=1 Tax=Vineibacter terrae TaxID=2586908 RepID=UPI0015B704D6|nr:formate dehydrogenase subunit delta [Vineibacter terrae]
MSPDKLVYMANQIGKFFAHQGEAKAVAGIADHIAKFWDPRMRAAIQAHAASGGAGLDPPVLQAVMILPTAGGEVPRRGGGEPTRSL